MIGRCLCVAPLIAALFARAAPSPPPPLPSFPSIARVKIDARGSTVIVTEDVSLPRGTWKKEPLSLHVAFGTPGAPRAIDAHLLAVPDGELDVSDDVEGEPLKTELVPRLPASARTLLGRPQMAGIVVHVAPEALERAFGPGNMVCVRIRSVIDVVADAQGARRVLVRLGAVEDKPLVLGRIVIARDPKDTGPAPKATLCGPDADRRPLAFVPRPKDAGRGLAPLFAARKPTDDLCIEL